MRYWTLLGLLACGNPDGPPSEPPPFTGPSTDEMLATFYEANGGRDGFPGSQVDVLEALLYAQDEIERGELDAARQRIDAVFDALPLSTDRWREGVGYEDLNIGDPVAYYGLRMLDQVLDLGNPSGAGTLTMGVVVATCAQVRRPTLPDLVPEDVELEIHPSILANDAYILHLSTALFRRWVQGITGGYTVELQVHTLEACANVDYTDDGETIVSYPDAAAMIDQVPSQLANGTDMWWVVAPSGVPGDGSGYDRHFITGGMGLYGPGLPLFLSDDGWFTRKPEHLGSGPYSDVELRAYQPQWFQHEFMHHLFRAWPEFELEVTDHQWFDRSTWPADFEGIYEPDYYAEALTKRLLNAEIPLGRGLTALEMTDFSDRDPSEMVGQYRREPVENGYHEVSISLTDGALRWENAAGVSWSLDIREDQLWAAEDCPYGVQALDVPVDEAGQILGVYFNGELYGRVP